MRSSAQARKPYSRSWLWIPGSLVSLAPRNDVVIGGRGQELKRPAAIDDMRDAGGERAFVAGEIDRERCDFLRRAEPPHRLAADEHLAPSGARGGGAVQHRRRLDGAGANTITSY